jgi:hypothetical protein
MGNLNFWIFVISFSFLIIFTLLFGLLGKKWQMFIAVIACSVGMAFSQLDKMETLIFNSTGFEARMKKVIEEASIRNLEKFSMTMASCIMDLVSSEGRAGGIRWQYKKQMYDNLVKRLRLLGLTDDQIKEIKENSLWDKYLLIDHVFMIREKIPKDKYSEITRNIDKQLFKPEIFYVGNPEDFRKLFKDNNILTNELEAIIEDLEYFIKNKKIRRPEVWREFFDRVE